jgi:anthranilate phosphoribosyltransferase
LIVGGITNDWHEALAIAKETINNGQAQKKLQQVVDFTQKIEYA